MLARILTSLSLLVLFIATPSFGPLWGQVSLVKDINTKPIGLKDDSNYATQFIAINNLVYFISESSFPPELWRTDGTTEGTYPIDVNVTELGSQLGEDLVYFKFTPNGQTELWKTDGTTTGKQLIIGNVNRPSSVYKFGDKVAFFSTGAGSTFALWTTDGTTEGTVKIGEVTSTLNSAGVWFGIGHGNTFYFTIAGIDTNLSQFVSQLWVIKGSNAPVLLTTFLGSSVSIDLLQDEAIVVHKNQSTNETALWKSDGTVIGTTLVKDLGQSFDMVWTYAFRGKLVVASSWLWITDGTSLGTELLYNDQVAAGVVHENNFYGVSRSWGQAKNLLLKTDGTIAGTQVLADLGGSPSDFLNNRFVAVANDKLILQLHDAAFGRELGVYDFTLDETRIIKDVWPGPTGSSARSFVPVAGKVVFIANDGVTASELWITDGTSEGTAMLKDTDPGTEDALRSANDFFLGKIGSDLVIYVTPGSVSSGNGIWKTDGTNAGTLPVVHLGPSVRIGSKNDEYYFLQGRKIVKESGVTGTVEVLKDLSTAVNSTQLYIDFNFILGSNFIFEFGGLSGPGALGTEFWITDGTEAGTHVLKDINPGSANAISGLSKGLKMSESLIVFPANDGTIGRELWRTDGTESGTVRVKDIFGGNSSSNPNHFALLSGKAYFQADDGIHGKELWVSDGTESGTTLLKDISDGVDGSSPQFLTTVGESIFFTAFQAAHGWALWKTDGTENGTVLVKDLHPSTENSFALLNLANVNGTLYFAGNDGSHGEELWTSDGTESGTKLIDIIPGSASSYPYGMTAVGSLIYLRANNELWRYSPHLQISERVSDMFPLGMIFHENELYFGAQSKLYGGELFKTPIAEKFGQGLVFSPIENKIEGGSSFTLAATSKTSSPIIYSSTSDKISISGNTVTLLKPGSVTIKATQAGDSNFNAAEQTQTFCINPTKPVITQSNANSPKPTLISNRSTGNTWKFSSVDIGDGAELIIEKSGTYTLTTSVENCVSEPATIDIPKVDQIITFPLEDKPLETGSFTLNATTNSGLPITYEINNDVLSITGGAATITKAGTVTITAKQAGDDLFNPSELSKTICITPSKPTISVSTVSGVPHLSSSYADGNSWLLNGSPLSLTGSSLVVSSAGVYNVKVTIDGCSSSLSDNVTIEKLSPSITFELTDQPFESGTFTLVGSASSGKDVSFTTTSSKVVLAGKVATIKEPGKVTITASTPSDALYNSAEVERTICILPAKPTISVTDPFAGGQTITSSASSGNQWYLNGSAITLALEKDLKVSASGNYSVQASIETCASPMSEPISMVVTGLMAESSASIFPNPAEKYVTIRVGGSEMIRGYQVISSSGVVVKSESVNQTECTIDVEHFTPGIYAISIQSERAFTVRKFAKK